MRAPPSKNTYITPSLLFAAYNCYSIIISPRALERYGIVYKVPLAFSVSFLTVISYIIANILYPSLLSLYQRSRNGAMISHFCLSLINPYPLLLRLSLIELSLDNLLYLGGRVARYSPIACHVHDLYTTLKR